MGTESESEVVYLPPEECKFYINNAKVHKKKMDLLRKSIQLFGFDQPVVVDENMVILKGHGRVMAAQNLGNESKLRQIPVLIRKGLSEEEKRLIRLADNMVYAEGQDDQRKKGEVMRSIENADISLFYAVDLPDLGDMELDMGFTGNEDDFEVSDVVLESEHPSITETAPTIPYNIVTCPKCGKVHKRMKGTGVVV